MMMVMMMVMMMAMMASRKLGNTWSRLLLTDVQGTQLSNLQMFFFRTIYNLKLAILLLQLWGTGKERMVLKMKCRPEIEWAIKADWCYQHLGHAKHLRALTEHTAYTGPHSHRWLWKTWLMGWALALAADQRPDKSHHQPCPGLGRNLLRILARFRQKRAEKPVWFSWGRYFADQHRI